MAEQPSVGRDSNAQLLEELESLSQTLYQSHTRRTASLALPRTAIPPIPSSADDDDDLPSYQKPKSSLKPLSRRMSLSPWRSRPKQDPPSDQLKLPSNDKDSLFSDDSISSEKKKGLNSIWNWKPMRALSHIGMQKISCLFSVEVVSVNGLPSSMNGLRLSVCVRKKETKEGAVNTMPSRVSQGAADFEETLFVKCHVYSPSPHKFDPRPFLIYVFAVDASELDFGRSSVDLSRLIQESAEKNAQGTRIRQWDTSFKLSGKAKGGELAVKLGFQIMEKDGGVGIFSNSNNSRASMDKPKTFSPSMGRKQSKTSFSIPSPKMSGKMQVWTPSNQGASARADSIQGFEELNLDEEPKQEPVQEAKEIESKEEDLDMPDFEVVDKGVEVQETNQERENLDQEREVLDDDAKGDEELKSESSEVVKEVVHDQFHLTRLSELDSIAQQIKALESTMGEENEDNEEAQSQGLDADEENVTREFLQMLEEEEGEEGEETGFKQYEFNKSEDGDQANVYLPDLGKGLGCIIQTRNGGFLAAMNPLDVTMSRKDTPKLAMQISKPFVIITSNGGGFELFQQMAGIGYEDLSSEILNRMSIEEIMGKTPEQIAFEGIASAIIHGRSKEGASSSAARTIAGLKNMASAMSLGRKERIETGIWNISEEALDVDEILPISLQKMEAMAIDGLKIQADMAEVDAPFDVNPIHNNSPLDSAVPFEEWIKKGSIDQEVVTMAVVIQLHDPLRRYEAVGGAMIGLIQASKEKGEKFKVTSLHLGGMKVERGQKRNAWDSEKQRLTAMQWLIAYGLGKGGKKGKVKSTKGMEMMWSLSSRVMADMWLKSMRNPDVKFTK